MGEVEKTKTSVSVWEWMPLVLAVLLFLLHTSLQRGNLQLAQTAETEMARHEEMDHLAGQLVQLLTDAESGQRGYLLTGRTVYLEPYHKARERIPENLRTFLQLMREKPSGTITPEQVNEVIGAKLEILDRVRTVYRREGLSAGIALVNSDLGKQRMDEVRRILATVQEEARAGWTSRMAMLEGSLSQALWMIYLLGSCVCLLLGIGTWRLVRSFGHADHLLRSLDEQRDQYHRLALTLQRGHEEERAAMSRKVHDEVGQNLTAAKMDISIGLRKIAEPEKARVTLERAIGTLEETLQTARAIATELRPPILDQLGLIAAVEWQFQEFQSRFGGKASWSAEIEEGDVSEIAKLALFRVLQEALTNVARHAEAKHVVIRLSRTGTKVAMSVSDDGVGMEWPGGAVKSLGLLGMRERMRAVGGDLEIQSEIGKGARVTASVPAAVET